MSRILYIPHYPDYTWIKNRSFIIAQQLSLYADVYYVHWQIPENKDLLSKLSAQIKNLSFNIIPEKRLKILHLPLLFYPKNSSLKLSFNELAINKIIKKLDISLVINAGMNLIRFANIKNIVKVYDIVDDHFDANQSLHIDNRRLSQLHDDIRCADLLAAVTPQIRHKLKDRFGLNAILLQNGIDLTQEQLLSIAKSQKDGNSKVFAFIGNIHHWVDLDLALTAFVRYTNDYPEDQFWIIGGGDQQYIDSLLNKYHTFSQIKFMGAIHQRNIYKYFDKIDIGVIPFRINSFTKNSFPIKAIEYGCFGAPVISTPIEALKQFQFVHFANTVAEWQRLYKKLRNINSPVEKERLCPYLWDGLVNTFWREHLSNLLA